MFLSDINSTRIFLKLISRYKLLITTYQLSFLKIQMESQSFCFVAPEELQGYFNSKDDLYHLLSVDRK